MNLKFLPICVIIFVNLFLQSRQYRNDLIVRNEVEVLVPKFLSGKDDILNSILQKINILSQTVSGSTATTIPPPTTTTARALTLAGCACYAVSTCSNVRDASGNRAVPATRTTPCPYGMLYCCPQNTTTPTTAPPTNVTTAPPTTAPPRNVTTAPPTNVTTAPPTTAPPTNVTTAPPTNQNNTAGCGCYNVTSCASITDGSGVIDLRIVTPNCPNGSIYCCPGNRAANVITPAGTEMQLVNITGCGIRATIPSNIMVEPGQARYGDYPWVAAILTMDNDFVSTGVLISNRHVLTVAHRVNEYILSENADSELKVRLGDWDAIGTVEPIKPEEYQIVDVVAHPNYNPFDLHNDLAIVEITPDVQLGTNPAINTACLPSPSTSFVNQECWVAGWGFDSLMAGNFQPILREVQVPVVDPAMCENLLRRTELGNNFQLYMSFLCAGGRPMMDACLGDGGAPLVCESTNHQWTVVGLVSWGIRCGEPDIPGVYTNVSALLPWINSQIR
ncbi:phenoloxidase-activating factor 2-like [Chrysoperla carnea]|uniref:phenoloxidase-activating factor 2-like n=1 Tax=Chrysoperla carnea TaxID=189513 RepID=UPI001D087C5F|nr:phenoloxidase-activating factor 2-like [Chrysoperla carnea]